MNLQRLKRLAKEWTPDTQLTIAAPVVLELILAAEERDALRERVQAVLAGHTCEIDGCDIDADELASLAALVGTEPKEEHTG